MERGAWRTAVHGVSKSRMRLSDFNFHLPFLIPVSHSHTPKMASPPPGTVSLFRHNK